MTATVDELLSDARRRLGEASFSPSRREAALLLGYVVGADEAQVLARGERVVEDALHRRFEALLARRLGGEPFAYLVGEREFFGRSFSVDDRVLIPRPESEHLVEEALALDLPEKPRILDLGTGSGCLAITLALELGATAVAVDLSPAALAVAAQNVAHHRLGNRLQQGPGEPSVTLACADLAGALDLSRFDLVVANPPYIERAEAAELSREILDFEPGSALFPPGGAAAFFSRLFGGLEALPPGGHVLVEIGSRQADLVAALLQGSSLELVGIRPDYAGRDRVARALKR